MADYRPDCGCFPTHTRECRARQIERDAEVAKKTRKSAMDLLYAKYGELIAAAQRYPNQSVAYHAKAEGVLEAIRIMEGEQ